MTGKEGGVAGGGREDGGLADVPRRVNGLIRAGNGIYLYGMPVYSAAAT